MEDGDGWFFVFVFSFTLGVSFCSPRFFFVLAFFSGVSPVSFGFADVRSLVKNSLLVVAILFCYTIETDKSFT